MSKDIVNTLKERGYPVIQAIIMDNMWYVLWSRPREGNLYHGRS